MSEGTQYQFQLATGETYVNRKTLKMLGGVWLPDEKGYAFKVDATVTIPGIKLETVMRWYDPFAPLSPDRIRIVRQARIDKIKARLLDRAERAERRSKEALDKVSPHERQFLSLGEPVKMGHHSQRRHQKLIERSQNSSREAAQEATYAAELRRRAENLGEARVAGDAQRRRDEKTAEARSMIGVGDEVRCVFFGAGVVTKMFQKTAWVQTANGLRRCGLVNLKLVSKGDPSKIKKSGGIDHEYAVGDVVLYHPACQKSWAWAVEVTRLNPRGYSIKYLMFDREHTANVAPDTIFGRAPEGASIDHNKKE